MNREEIIQPIGKLLISQTVEPNITFHPGDPAKEVMRIDKMESKSIQSIQLMRLLSTF